jgi:hypothetical protein
MSVKPTVTFRAVDPRGTTVVALLGDGVPAVGGGGGWTTVQRQKQSAITEWQGADPLTLDIPIVFDGFRRYASIERYVNTLYRWMRAPVGPRHEPVVVTVAGPIPYTPYRWVINAITPGTDTESIIRRTTDGQMMRWVGSVSLMQYVPGNVIVSHKHSPAKRHKTTAARKGATTRVHYYTVRRGDTLGKIAARLLHNANRWHDIARLNGIRDPNKIRVGQRLKIPA